MKSLVNSALFYGSGNNIAFSIIIIIVTEWHWPAWCEKGSLIKHYPNESTGKITGNVVRIFVVRASLIVIGIDIHSISKHCGSEPGL